MKSVFKFLGLVFVFVLLLFVVIQGNDTSNLEDYKKTDTYVRNGVNECVDLT